MDLRPGVQNVMKLASYELNKSEEKSVVDLLKEFDSGVRIELTLKRLMEFSTVKDYVTRYGLYDLVYEELNYIAKKNIPEFNKSKEETEVLDMPFSSNKNLEKPFNPTAVVIEGDEEIEDDNTEVLELKELAKEETNSGSEIVDLFVPRDEETPQNNQIGSVKDSATEEVETLEEQIEEPVSEENAKELYIQDQEEKQSEEKIYVEDNITEKEMVEVEKEDNSIYEETLQNNQIGSVEDPATEEVETLEEQIEETTEVNSYEENPAKEIGNVESHTEDRKELVDYGKGEKDKFKPLDEDGFEFKVELPDEVVKIINDRKKKSKNEDKTIKENKIKRPSIKLGAPIFNTNGLSEEELMENMIETLLLQIESVEVVQRKGMYK